ncbi:MAG: UDP-N-acetylmuramate dehydrogenase [Spirochaetales bacterium]|nr:UDP-N-acetylmuramate dehydrogenase [Spirochaetales bacterium]
MNVRNKLEKINITGKILRDVSMNLHTTFETGGSADYFALPSSVEDLVKLLNFAKKYSVPVFILGGGANILVSDSGIRGLVVDMRNLSELRFEDTLCTAGAGCSISELADTAAGKNLGGLDFIYGMPGSVGGAVWMNARCYDVSISDILIKVDYLDEKLERRSLGADEISNSFAYKDSPFQHSSSVILSATFRLAKGDQKEIRKKMDQHKEDRESKGHYRYPCAGSVFKNNRAFGKPTGVIIDSLGLKGYSRGGAQIADFHGNIIVNTGNARSKDIKSIVDYTRELTQRELGLKLETEIQFVGDWDGEEGEKETGDGRPEDGKI